MNARRSSIAYNAQSPAHWLGGFDLLTIRHARYAMLTIAAGLIVSVFFAVWNPEKVYVGEYIICP